MGQDHTPFSIPSSTAEGPPKGLPPQTLAWIGPTAGPTWSHPFAHCTQFARQVALRDTFCQLLEHPPSLLTHIVVAREDRCAAPKQLAEAKNQFPGAKLLVLANDSCEGLARAGCTWAGVPQIPWYRWQETLPAWLLHTDTAKHFDKQSTQLNRPSLVVGLLSQPNQATSALTDCLNSAGHTALLLRSPCSLRSLNADLLLWDDSLITGASAPAWKDLLSSSRHLLSLSPPAEIAGRHFWCVSFPRVYESQAALTGGVTGVISKPIASSKIPEIFFSTKPGWLCRHKINTEPWH